MKKSFSSLRTLVLIIAISPLLLQCASQDEIKNLHYQLRIVSQKVDTMKANTVSSIQKRQASSSSKLDRIQADILQLKSRVEELSHANRLIQEQQKEHSAILQTLTNQQRKQLEAAAALKAARIKEAELKAKEAKLAAERARARRQQAEISMANRNKSHGGIETIRAKGKNKIIKYAAAAPPPDQPTQKKVENPTPDTDKIPADKLMERSLRLFNEKKFQKSFDSYKSFIGRNPSSPLVIKARYMMGESLYNLQQYNQAIMEYQKIISSHPKDPNAVKALFRQGNCFEKLSDLETAKMIYKKLIGSYSSSPEASQAKQLLNKL